MGSAQRQALSDNYLVNHASAMLHNLLQEQADVSGEPMFLESRCFAGAADVSEDR